MKVYGKFLGNTQEYMKDDDSGIIIRCWFIVGFFTTSSTNIYYMCVCVWFIAGYIPVFGMICRPQMVDNQMGLWFLCAFH